MEIIDTRDADGITQVEIIGADEEKDYREKSKWKELFLMASEK